MILAILLAAAAAPALAPGPLDGDWTNEEQVYFAKEAGRAGPSWTGFRIKNGQWRPIDRFGQPTDRLVAPPPAVSIAGQDRMAFTLGGQQVALRKGRPMTCWMAVRKDAPKPGGGEDWLFVRGLKSHDQGGRVRVGGAGTGATEATIRLRNVIWPPPTTNRPSVVIYVFEAKDQERAISYAWADPGVRTLGINLRWMQASCTVDGESK